MSKNVLISLSEGTADELRGLIQDIRSKSGKYIEINWNAPEFTELFEQLDLKLESERVREKLEPNFAPKGGFCGYYPPDGWTKLVEQCHDAIVAIDPAYKIDQVKEKFGGLRFYFTNSGEYYDDELFDKCNAFVSECEKLSYETCQDCGKPGETREGGWLRTLCDKCYEDRGN